MPPTKRALSAAGSPPPATTKAKKPRPSRPKASKAKGTPAASPPGSTPASPFPLGGASSPPAADSPLYLPGTGTAAGSRERSASVAIDPALGGGGGGGGDKGKGKERAVDGQEGQGAPGQTAQGMDEDEEAEDEQFEFDDDEFGSNQREAAKQKEDLRVLLEHFDEQQMDRYEAYRRSGLTKGAVKKLINQVLGQSVAPSIITVVRGFAKVFVGEIVEKARSVADHPGALTPQDLREAYRLYLEEHEGAGAGGAQRKKLFVK
ncbi:hypothetical protein JCM10207_005205 [Rhodosporidiobolus poonsookiae]